MKNPTPNTSGQPTLLLLLSMAVVAFTTSVQALDYNIDPYNLGKSDQIYYLSTATNKLGGNVPSVTSVATLMSYEKSQGMDAIVIKVGTGSTNFPSTANPQVTASVISAAHAAGLKIIAYTRSFGDDIPGEIALATNYLAMGCDGFVIDAEAEWESSRLGTNGPSKAIQLCTGIKNAYPNRFLGHAPFMYISLHSSFPYKEFGYYCDTIMPQIYWTDFSITPAQAVADHNTEFRNFHNTLSGVWTNAIKPIAPIGNAYHTTMPATEVTDFITALKTNANPPTFMGYKGVSYWRADLHTSNMWVHIKAGNLLKTNAAIITNVVSVDILDHSARIAWQTDISCDSVVEYGLTTSYGSIASNSTKCVFHSLTITNLAASTTYNYRIKAKNMTNTVTTSGNFTFATLAEGAVPDIIIDNPSAAAVGSWLTGSSSTDKYGADYRYKSKGTGSAYLQYTPNILKSGSYDIYEWHTIGGNRSAVAPHVITYNGGSSTVNVNQKVAGGVWNLLGRFNLVVGTSGNVKITDGATDTNVFADAIKFAYVPPPPPPTAPSGLAGTASSSSQINLTWVDNANNEDNMIVSRSGVSGGPYTDIATLAANATAYSNTGLAPSTTYYYVVRAVNVSGSSALSAQASAKTLLAPPPAPSGLAASTAGITQINLSWTDNATNESSFVVARATVSGGPYTDVTTLGANVTTYNDTGLTGNTTYYYVVRASNTAGSSANSAQASATTLPYPPNAPSALVATALSQTSIKLTWTDNSANETSFVVGRSLTSGGPYTDIATLGANVTVYTNTGLSPSKAYYFVVRAANAGGASANSAQATATTLAVPDIIIDNGSATVTGSWSTATSSTDKYGTDYRFKSKGTGAAYLTFTPTIVYAGNYLVYEWHPQGSNRPTNAPVILSYSGGSRTNRINQTVNGGTWVACGAAVNFAAGTAGYVRVSDLITETNKSVMADAIKLVYVP